MELWYQVDTGTDYEVHYKLNPLALILIMSGEWEVKTLVLPRDPMKIVKKLLG